MSDFKQLSRSVKGLTALVTGAASGMGRATALVFAAEGANVAVTDINLDATQAVAGEITSKGGAAKAWTLDVAKPDEIIKVVNDVAAHFGSLDIVINNAGISVRVAIDDDGYEAAWDKALAVMLTAHHPRCAAAFAPVEEPTHPQYRVDRSARRDRIAQSLFGGESRRHRLDTLACGGARSRGHHRELHLPGPDPHCDHRADFRGAQDDLRQTPHRTRPLWRP
jgi:NAD(P)-dependent dehydrogenase (short-subunit alcohol dehydrogenase family)